MPIRKIDLAVYVFVLAVMLSGMWIVDQFEMEWSPPLFAAAGVVAAVWTAYYRYAVEPRIEAAASDGEERREPDGETGTTGSPAEDRPDRGRE